MRHSKSLRAALALALGLAAFFPARPVPAEPPGSEPSDEIQPLLKRIFASKDFAAKRFGPARWIEGGRAYTTVEGLAEADSGRSIVRCDAKTGERRVLVPAARLVPGGEKKPLSIDDYELLATRSVRDRIAAVDALIVTSNDHVRFHMS